MRGLAEFESKYFCGRLFLSDPERKLYEFLGSKPIFTIGGIGRMLLNPFKARREMKALGDRMKTKNVEGNMVGDGLTKGGVFVVGPDGELKHVFSEDAGKGIPEENQKKIVESVRSFRAVAS
jgi:hypothetical protein